MEDKGWYPVSDCHTRIFQQEKGLKNLGIVERKKKKKKRNFKIPLSFLYLPNLETSFLFLFFLTLPGTEESQVFCLFASIFVPCVSTPSSLHSKFRQESRVELGKGTMTLYAVS